MRRRGKRWLGAVLSLVLVLTCFLSGGIQLTAKEKSTGTDYYVDSVSGDDSNTGTSEAQAWKTLDKVNETTFQPGDRLLFKKGSSWTGQLSPKGSGEKGNPIIIGAYGEGEERPLIQGNNWCGENGDDLTNRIFNAAVYFYNQQYWEITSLEVTNRIPGDNPDDHIKKYGILIMGEDAGTLEHMYCQDLYVHDVVSHPIGQQAGIGRGGIIYIIRGNKVPTNWNDIVVENNKVGPNINHYGINFLSTWGSNTFESESGIPDSEHAAQRYDSTNLVIRNNYCKDIGNAAICPSAYANALIEYNTCDGCNSGPNGNVPIWWENGQYTVAQYNEVFGSGASDSKEDSQAFDADINATLNYIQYNYTHDNPSGAYFECAIGSRYTTYIRYNISQNDGYGTNMYGGGAIVTIGGNSTGENNKMYVYNNDFYLDGEHNSFITNSWDGKATNPEHYLFANNVIYSDATTKGWDENLKGTALNNAYGGSDTGILRDDDTQAVTISKDDFKNLGTGGTGISSTDGYQLSANSVLKGAGTTIEDNGGLDYWGNEVSATGIPNIGCDNSGAKIEDPEGVIDFEDREEGQKALKGDYKNCVFGENWMTQGNTANKTLAMTDDVTSNTIVLPAGKALKNFKAKCSDIAWLTVEAGGYKKSFSLTSAMNTFETGFSSAADEVTFTVNAPAGSSDVKFDDLLLVDAEYERTNLALNKEAATSGYDQYPGSYGNDGDEGSMWIHAGEDLNEWWSVDLGADYDLSDFELIFEKDEETPWKYQIEGRNSTQADYDAIPIYDANENTEGAKVQTGTFEPGSVYRYLRVRITGMPGGDYWPGFAEFKAYERDNAGLDKSGLTNKIVEAKYIEQGEYTDESFANLQNAIAEAKTAFGTAQDESDVTAAIEALQKAIDGLTGTDQPEPYVRTNLALNKDTETSGNDQEGNEGSKGNDGDETTLWIHAGEELNEWWSVDLGKDYDLSDFELYFEQDEDNGAWKYQIEGRNSTQADYDAIPIYDATENTDGARKQTGTFEPGSVYRYVRVRITGFPGADSWPAFGEFCVYDRDNTTLNRSALTNRIVEAKYIQQGDASDEAYAALQQAVAAAKEAFNAAATPEDVKAAEHALKTAIDDFYGVTTNYQVLYDVNGGKPETIAPKTDVAWDDASLLPEAPSRDGYTFQGWKYNDKDVTDSTKYSDLAADTGVESITLTAQWKINSYTVKYSFASGDVPDGIQAPQPVTADYGSMIAAPQLTIPEDWTFDGWYTDKDCTAKYDFAGAITGDLELYGKWSKKGGQDSDSNTQGGTSGGQQGTGGTGAGGQNTGSKVQGSKAAKTADTADFFGLLMLMGCMAVIGTGISVYRRRAR